MFHHLTYEGAVDIESVADGRERLALEAQINEFGQCPRVLFPEPHPRRLVCPSTDTALQLAAGAHALFGNCCSWAHLHAFQLCASGHN